jgi:hypothetical protein
MVRYVSFLFIILFVIQSSYNTFVFIQFKTQQNYIAQELCVNRAEPMNDCKGKCYLKAHLQKEDTASDFSIAYLKGKVELFFSVSFFTSAPTLFYVKPVYANMPFEHPVQTCNGVFHPPA